MQWTREDPLRMTPFQMESVDVRSGITEHFLRVLPPHHLSTATQRPQMWSRRARRDQSPGLFYTQPRLQRKPGRAQTVSEQREESEAWGSRVSRNPHLSQGGAELSPRSRPDTQHSTRPLPKACFAAEEEGCLSCVWGCRRFACVCLEQRLHFTGTREADFINRCEHEWLL